MSNRYILILHARSEPLIKLFTMRRWLLPGIVLVPQRKAQETPHIPGRVDIVIAGMQQSQVVDKLDIADLPIEAEANILGSPLNLFQGLMLLRAERIVVLLVEGFVNQLDYWLFATPKNYRVSPGIKCTIASPNRIVRIVTAYRSAELTCPSRGMASLGWSVTSVHLERGSSELFQSSLDIGRRHILPGGPGTRLEHPRKTGPSDISTGC